MIERMIAKVLIPILIEQGARIIYSKIFGK